MYDEYQDAINLWNFRSINERLELIIAWELKDAYPYGHSNSKKRFDKIKNHYLVKNILKLKN